MVIKKKKPAPAPLNVLVKCSWSGARIPTPSTLSTSSTLSQVISSISSSLPPLINKPLGEWNEPQPFIVYMRTNVLKRDWEITKLSDFCDGGSILLTLNLPKDEPATDTGAAASNDSSEPMDIDVGGSGETASTSLPANTFSPKTPKEAMRIILKSNFDLESKECLQTILKMVDNLLSKSDAKFRSIRITNKTVEKKVTDRKGGLDLLFALGFEYDSSKAGFDFDNSNNVPQQSETIVLRPENEDKDLLVDARGHLSEILMTELNDEKVPSMPRVKPIAVHSAAGNETKSAPFDPFRSQSYNIQAAAAGAPNPNSINPDGSTGKSTTERKLEILQQKQERLEQSIQSLGDRGIVAFRPLESGAIVTINSPGDDILDGKGDSSLLAGLAKNKMDERKKREEGGFQTKSMRKFLMTLSLF